MSLTDSIRTGKIFGSRETEIVCRDSSDFHRVVWYGTAKGFFLVFYSSSSSQIEDGVFVFTTKNTKIKIYLNFFLTSYHTLLHSYKLPRIIWSSQRTPSFTTQPSNFRLNKQILFLLFLSLLKFFNKLMNIILFCTQ